VGNMGTQYGFLIFMKRLPVSIAKNLYCVPIFLLFFVLLAANFTPQPIYAEELLPTQLGDVSGPMTISADEIVYWRKENRYTAKGKVIIVTDRYTLTCDEAKVNNETGEVRARGKVKIKSEEYEIECESFSFNRTTEQGVLVKGTLYIVEMHATIGAQKIEKIGPGAYLIENASYTTCLCKEGEKPDWSVTARRIKLKEEGYAKTRGATFRIKDTPILYLPMAMFPVKQKRQTGFLVPDAGYSSRDGFEFALPFYVAAARWWDFTITERYIQERGIKQELEVRWVRRHGREGELNAYYLDDWKVGINRWAFSYEGRVPLALGVEWRQDMRWISDNEYIKDFKEDDLVESRARSLESRLILDRRFSWGEVSLFFRGIDDLQGDDIGLQYGYSDSDGDQSHQLPRLAVRTALVPIPHTPLFFGGRSAINNFYRESPSGASVYGYNDIQRGKIFPFLGATFRPRRGIYLTPEAGWQATAWKAGGYDYARSLAVGKAETGFRLYRIFKDRYKHTVEPRTRYMITREIGSESPPFLDKTDLLSDHEVVEFNLDQHFLVRRTDKRGTPRGMDVLQLEITQRYMPEDETWRMLRGQLEIRPSDKFKFDADTRYSLHRGAYHYATAGFTVEDKREDKLTVMYRYQGEDNWEFLKNRLRVPVTKVVALTYFNFINLTEGRFVDHGGGVKLTPTSECWTLRTEVSYHTDPEEVRFRLWLNLYGLGSAGSK